MTKRADFHCNTCNKKFLDWFTASTCCSNKTKLKWDSPMKRGSRGETIKIFTGERAIKLLIKQRDEWAKKRQLKN